MATVEVSGSQPHILKASAVTVTAAFYSDGVLTDPGATTVAAVNLVGTTVVASGAAGGAGTSRTVALSAVHTANLDTLVITWTTANLGTLVTRHEIVGAFLFTVAAARAFRPNDSGGAPLASTTKYTPAAIENTRAAILDELETITGQAFVPRYRYEVIDGSGVSTLYLPVPNLTAIRSIDSRTSGAAAWTAYTGAEVADVYAEPFGEVIRESLGTFSTGRRNYRVGYEYGHTTPPRDIANVALMMLLDNLIASNVSDRAISVSGEFGTEQMFTAGISARGQALYSSPEVHRVLSNHVARRLVIA